MKISVVIWRLVFLIVVIEILGLLFYNFWHPASPPATPAIKQQNSPIGQKKLISDIAPGIFRHRFQIKGILINLSYPISPYFKARQNRSTTG